MTQGRPSQNRADPGLRDAIPLGLSKGFLSHIAERAISIPLKTSRNLFLCSLRLWYSTLSGLCNLNAVTQGRPLGIGQPWAEGFNPFGIAGRLSERDIVPSLVGGSDSIPLGLQDGYRQRGDEEAVSIPLETAKNPKRVPNILQIIGLQMNLNGSEPTSHHVARGMNAG